MASQILQILSVVTAVASLGWIIWVGRKLQVLDDLQATSEKIKHNVKVISDFLIAKAGDFNHSELQNYSPLALTENGEKFIRDLGFDKVFEANKADFFNCIDHDAPKLKYDVEISAIRSIYYLAEKPYMSFLKVYLYNNPARSMDNVAPTLAVYVRDKYLAEHLDIAE